MPSDPAMDFYVSQLSHLPDRAQELMCEKAARQLDTFGKFPTLKQLLEVSGVPSPEDQENAESLMAWDALIRYVNKYVTTDGEGNKVLRDPSWHGKRITEAEKLTDERTLQVVRMMGGWGKFAYLPTDIEQFVRKDFIEMYKLRPAIDYVKDFKALGIGFDLKKLAEGKKM